MFILNNWIDGYRNIFNYEGCEGRKAYCFFFLSNLVLACAFIMILGLSAEEKNDGLFGFLIIIGILLYTIFALSKLSFDIRRLHDCGYSGWFVLFSFVIGGILTLILMCIPSKLENNPYR